MLAKLPLSSVYRVASSDRALSSPRLYAMSVGYGAPDGDRFTLLALVEVEPDRWVLRGTDELQFSLVSSGEESLLGDCVTKEGLPDMVGFVLPNHIEDRRVSSHVVVKDPGGRFLTFEDIDAVTRSYGPVNVGHRWGEPDAQGWRNCDRCREKWWNPRA